MKEFISLVSSSESLYGLRPDTLNSLVISLLHSVGHVHTHKEMEEQTLVIKSSNIQFCIMQATLQALRDTGLLIPEVNNLSSYDLYHLSLIGLGYSGCFKLIQ